MPTHKIDAATHESTAQRKARVEGELRELQDANRLGVHMYEKVDRLAYPSFSQQGFSALTGKSTKEAIENYKVGELPLNSLSLVVLPKSSHFQPFHMTRSLDSRLGYFFDLRQDVPNAAKVVRVIADDLGSGWDVYNKKLHIPIMPQRGGHIPYAPIDDIYKDYCDDAELIEAVSRNPDELGNKQLDALAGIYSDPHANYAMTGYNEVVAAISNDHLRAVVAFTAQKKWASKGTIEPFVCRALAAISALDHLQHGINVPAIVYDLDERERSPIHYVGQGKEELKAAIVENMTEMYANHREQLYDGYVGWYDIVKAASSVMGVGEKKLQKQVELAASSINR